MGHYLDLHGVQELYDHLHVKVQTQDIKNPVDADPGDVKKYPIQRGTGEQVSHEHGLQVACGNLLVGNVPVVGERTATSHLRPYQSLVKECTRVVHAQERTASRKAG